MSTMVDGFRPFPKNSSTDEGEFDVIKDASFKIDKAKWSRSSAFRVRAKQTLLQISRRGSDRPSAGTVSIAGSNLSTLPDAAIARFRNISIGFVFQFHHLLPDFHGN